MVKLKKILLGLLMIASVGAYSQTYPLVIDKPTYLKVGAQIGNNGSFIDSVKAGVDTLFVWAGGIKYGLLTKASAESSLEGIPKYDTLSLNSTQLLAGGNFSILKANKPYKLKSLELVYTANTIAYTTTGTTDSIKVRVKTNAGDYTVAALNDNIFNETLFTPASASVSTFGGMVDSCNYFLNIPTGKLSAGNGSIDLIYEYR